MRSGASSLSLRRAAAAALPAGSVDAPPAGHWLDRWRRRHSLAASTLFFLAAGAFALGLEVGAVGELVLLTAGVAVFGLPHGALDHLSGRELFEPTLGRRWPLGFGASYLGLAGLVVGLWLVAPVLALGAFLGYSAWHFGVEDASRSARGKWAERLESSLRGSVPIALPCLFHPAAVTEAFDRLLPAGAGSATVLTWWTGTIGLVMVALVSTLWLTNGGRAVPRRTALELVALVALFAFSPPLIAFTLYFCALHSPRQLLRVAERVRAADPARAVERVAREALPLTMTTIALAVVAGLLLAGRGVQVDDAVSRVVLIGLSALTVPHMVLDSLAGRRI